MAFKNKFFKIIFSKSMHVHACMHACMESMHVQYTYEMTFCHACMASLRGF